VVCADDRESDPLLMDWIEVEDGQALIFWSVTSYLMYTYGHLGISDGSNLPTGVLNALGHNKDCKIHR
jgi:hypothetical protein